MGMLFNIGVCGKIDFDKDCLNCVNFNDEDGCVINMVDLTFKVDDSHLYFLCDDFKSRSL